MRSFIKIAAAFAVAAATLTAQAQLAPQKPVTIVVPYPAGGPLDNAAHILAEKLRPLLKTEVLVDNRPGSGGNVGAALVAKAPADGHTLVMTPAASVSGFYLSHPQSTYFNVGKIGDDQLQDLAQRRGLKAEELQRLLAPNL